MNSARILITGANGFTGRHACQHFSAAGMRVTAVVRSKDHAIKKDPAAPYCKVSCDLAHQDQVKRLVGEVRPQYVLHLAGRNHAGDSWQEPVSYLETNVMGTVYLLDALRQTGPCRILVAGSMLSFPLSGKPQPPHPYSLSKTMQVLVSQSWHHLYGLDLMVAEPSNLIGPGYSNGICGLLARKIVNFEQGLDLAPFKLSSTLEKRDFVDVRDAVSAYGIMLESGKAGAVYPVGSGSSHSLGDLIACYQSLAGKPLPLEIGHLTNPQEPKPVDMIPLRELGWRPRIRFQTSVEDTLNFFRGV
ncbi:MAG TPA: NAD-dependent epimerase/dehydratase family protein [Bacilli bacterium]